MFKAIKPKHLALLGAIVFAMPAAAQDAPPPRIVGNFNVDKATSAPLQVTRKVRLNATPEVLFEEIATNENWVQWIDAIDSLESVKGSGATTERKFKAGDNLITERFLAFEDNQLIAYSVRPGNPFGLEDHVGVLVLTTDESIGSVLEWRQYYNHAQPAAINPAIDGVMAGVLTKLVGVHGGEALTTAIGGGRIVITASRIIQASKASLWDATANDFGSVWKWASVVDHSSAKLAGSSPGVGDQRSCQSQVGNVREQMTAYDERKGTFAYKILEGAPPFVTNAVNTWTLESLGKNATRLTMQLELDVRPGTPGQAVGMVNDGFHQAIDFSIDDLRHFIEEGAPHPRKAAMQKKR